MKFKFLFEKAYGKLYFNVSPLNGRLEEIVHEIAKRALNAIVFSKESRDEILYQNNETRAEIKKELLNPLDSSSKMQAICYIENLWDFDYVVVDGVPDYTIYNDEVLNALKILHTSTIVKNLKASANANAYRRKLAEAGMLDEEFYEFDEIEDLVDDVKNMDELSLPFVFIPNDEGDPESSLHLLNLKNLKQDKIIQIFVENLRESLTNQKKLIDSFEILIEDNSVHLEINLFKTKIQSVGRAFQKKIKKLNVIEKWQMLTNENPKINPKDNMTNFQRRTKEDKEKYESDMPDMLSISRAETIIKKLLTF